MFFSNPKFKDLNNKIKFIFNYVNLINLYVIILGINYNIIRQVL